MNVGMASSSFALGPPPRAWSGPAAAGSLLIAYVAVTVEGGQDPPRAGRSSVRLAIDDPRVAVDHRSPG